MSGALLQIAATDSVGFTIDHGGSHRSYIQRYSRRMPIALESIEHTFDDTPGYGKRATLTLERKGDLVRNIVLEFTLKKADDTAFYPAEHFIREVQLEIGDRKIDTITNTWLRIYDELYRPVDSRESYRVMTDFDADDPVGYVKRFYVSLPFWFCTDPKAPLPLVAMQHESVKLHFTFEDAANIPGVDATFTPEISAWVDYAYLSRDERMAIVHAPRECLIEQTQVYRTGATISSTQNIINIDPPFNFPTKYLVWVLKRSENSHGLFTASDTGLVSSEIYGPIAEASLLLNGTERFRKRKGSYFRLCQSHAAFGRTPSVGVYTYSFADDATTLDPNGTLDFSVINSVKLQLTTKAATLASIDDATAEDETLASSNVLGLVEVYARNFNILRTVRGHAGVMLAA